MLLNTAVNSGSVAITTRPTLGVCDLKVVTLAVACFKQDIATVVLHSAYSQYSVISRLHNSAVPKTASTDE
jgi:hypothetical protein